MPSDLACTWIPQIRHVAEEVGINKEMFVSLIYQESKFDPNIPAGIAQIDSRFHDVDPQEPIQALFYAANLLARYKQNLGRWDLALAAYKEGYPRIESTRQVPFSANAYVLNILNGTVTGDLVCETQYLEPTEVLSNQGPDLVLLVSLILATLGR